ALRSAIDHGGVVVGRPAPDGGFGCMYASGVMTRLASFGYTSTAADIDDSGRIVGAIRHPYYGNQAVIWENGNPFFLDAIAQSGWVFQEARGISDDGQYIAGYGYNAQLGYNGAILLEEVRP